MKIENPKTSEDHVPLSDERATLEILSKSLLGLWETVNNLTRLRPTKRERYRVTIFGSARVDPSHWVYGAVRDVAAELTRLGCDIVTGGGPGLMQAANEGAKLADPDETQQKSMGIRVELPFEQDVNAFVTDAFEHKTFFTRLHHFVLVSDAFIVCPGGIGTVLEMLMVWQLLQVRHLHDTPLILAGHFWDGMLEWSKDQMLQPDIPLVSPTDLQIPQVLADGPSIVAAIRDHHAQLPEALEKWPVKLFEALLPRHLEIVYEINRRFLRDVQSKYPGDDARLAQVNVIEEGPDRKVRMANLAIVGTHSTNGVAAIHSELLRTQTVPDFAELFPERFNNKTNGVTPRRWLLLANPDLAKLLTDAVGKGWETGLSRLRKIDPLATDAGFRDKFLAAKRGAKACCVDWIKSTVGVSLDPDTLFDVQIKRIHEYKRQLLNAIQVVVWYNRLLANPNLDVPPRTVLFAGKAAPAYHLAKVIIKLITSIGRVVNAEPAVRGKLRVEFLPNYSCTLAEYLIPATDVSEQISTAGYEASGTGNMKFMMNGALTVGTRDGANIEIAEEGGEENAFMFGLTTEQVVSSRGWYNPHWHYDNEPETRAALDMIFGNHFSAHEPGIFEPIRETLLTKGNYYMHLADLSAYVQTQGQVADYQGVGGSDS